MLCIYGWNLKFGELISTCISAISLDIFRKIRENVNILVGRFCCMSTAKRNLNFGEFSREMWKMLVNHEMIGKLLGEYQILTNKFSLIILLKCLFVIKFDLVFCEFISLEYINLSWEYDLGHKFAQIWKGKFLSGFIYK